MSDAPKTIKLTPMEQAMTWEKMSGERLSDVERNRILAGGEFVRPVSPPTARTVGISLIPAKPEQRP